MSVFPAPSFLVFRSPGGAAGEHAGGYWVRMRGLPVSMREAIGCGIALFSNIAPSPRRFRFGMQRADYSLVRK
ncbi:hypothetical protein SAMN05216515_13512 [Eubacterium pyruvativorans]|uniref:Uncharacterized protein n=1 Tax=Eubacterium pyruvativorans TaxID=155865 RepID=A0A1I7I5R0_9FIRM|nr:hypothetical protein SAMN05216515_13512 [Eubacterium pyruvativorans]SFU68285.1 hypothetical protein SAMN05216508_13213 [Eubacterium pyruvativorans]